MNSTGWGSRHTASGQFLVRAAREPPRRVVLPNDMSYDLQHGHVEADEGFVSCLLTWLTRAGGGGASGADAPSLSDFGAGVGQYGRALLSRAPHFPYRGYDAAGDVVSFTDGFVGFLDLTLPSLSLPLADYVMSLEVAEHVPNKFEAALVRNLHAHNRVGLILSWGTLNQPGVAHINNHNQSYVSALFEALGYHRNLPFERALRLAAKASPWLSRNVLVLERWTPLTTTPAAARAKGRRL